MQPDSNYPLSNHFTLAFSAYEDRLLLTTQRGQKGPATVLLTRRMTVLLINRLLSKLPDMSGLEQTPRAYWQDVLQMAHQRAVAEQASHKNQGEASERPTATSAQTPVEPRDTDQTTPAPAFYLATELTSERRDDRLLLGFKGLPVPEAMRTPCKHEPVVAFTLEAEKVHQFLELVIVKAAQAQWHIPMDLPWLEPVDTDVDSTTVSH